MGCRYCHDDCRFCQSGNDGDRRGGVSFSGHTGIADLDQAYLTLEPLLSHAAATVFGLSLVAAGLSSTVVGTLAGQVVMQGFVRFHIPLWVRRTITMLPSFIVILMGLDPTRILVMSRCC